MSHKIKLFGTAFFSQDELLGDGDFRQSLSDQITEIARDDHWIILWEDPIRMIFRKINEPFPTSSEDLLQQWMESAKQILKSVRRHRGQTALIHIEEAQAYPVAFERYCAEQLGLEIQLPSSGQQKLAALIPLFQKTTQQSIRELLPLLQELEASSVTLDSNYDSEYSTRGLSPAAVYSAIGQLKSLELDGIPREELEAAIGKVEALQNELEVKKRLLAQREDELNQSEAKALENYEMLLTELHEAFKESEGYFEQWKKAESTGRGLLLKVDSVSREAVVDDGAHRHLDYSFNGLDLLGRSWPTLRVRLVRHNGRPGILFFEAGTAPFYAWEPSGQEGGVNFMLVVPSDAPARDFLIRATTSDLVLIIDCATTILADLKVNGFPDGTPTDWISVAETLLQQFEEIPERLHYDTVRSRMDGEKARSLEFDIVNASFRGRFYPSIRLSWETDSGKVTIFPDESGGPIFSGWPVDEQGRNRATCEFFREPSPQQKAPTSPLTELDKNFLSVLLGEMPNFLVHAGSQHPQEAARLKSLSGKAKGLVKKTRKLKAL